MQYKKQLYEFWQVKILDKKLPSLSLCLVALRSSSLVIERWWWAPNGIVGIVVEAVWAAFNAMAGGNIGLHGECELADALEDVRGTPDDEYKSWLNCLKIIKTKIY